MDKNKARNLLREFVKIGCVAFSSHCRLRMLERNVYADDILNVLMWGKVKNVHRDTQHQNWKCEVEGKDLDDENLTIQAAVYEEKR